MLNHWVGRYYARIIQQRRRSIAELTRMKHTNLSDKQIWLLVTFTNSDVCRGRNQYIYTLYQNGLVQTWTTYCVITFTLKML